MVQLQVGFHLLQKKHLALAKRRDDLERVTKKLLSTRRLGLRHDFKQAIFHAICYNSITQKGSAKSSRRKHSKAWYPPMNRISRTSSFSSPRLQRSRLAATATAARNKDLHTALDHDKDSPRHNRKLPEQA